MIDWNKFKFVDYVRHPISYASMNFEVVAALAERYNSERLGNLLMNFCYNRLQNRNRNLVDFSREYEFSGETILLNSEDFHMKWIWCFFLIQKWIWIDVIKPQTKLQTQLIACGTRIIKFGQTILIETFVQMIDLFAI